MTDDRIIKFLSTRSESTDVYEQDWSHIDNVELDVDKIEEELLDEEEFETSFEFSVDSEPVVCNDCGKVNDVADPMLLHLLNIDQSCLHCGNPLEIIR